MNWTQTPKASGWWFWTEKLENWDLAKPFPVWSYESGDHVVKYVVRTAPEIERNVADVGGWWYGPFKMQQPGREIPVFKPIATLKKVEPAWNEVVVVAAEGTSFGIVSDADGTLTIVTKPPGTKDWPHGTVPTSGQNTIARHYTKYHVIADKPAEPKPVYSWSGKCAIQGPGYRIYCGLPRGHTGMHYGHRLGEGDMPPSLMSSAGPDRVFWGEGERMYGSAAKEEPCT